MRSVLLLAALSLAAAAPADPDWPCAQRLVPTLTAATLWSGPAAQHDWRGDSAIAPLVAEVAPRRLPVAQGMEKLKAFAAAHPDADARAALFAGLVERSNLERSEAIDRLRRISRRLRGLAEAIVGAARQLDALPADADARQDAADRRALLIRQYDDLNGTVRYACEIPVDFEHRLGQFGRVLAPD